MISSVFNNQVNQTYNQPPATLPIYSLAPFFQIIEEQAEKGMDGKEILDFKLEIPNGYLLDDQTAQQIGPYLGLLLSFKDLPIEATYHAVNVFRKIIHQIFISKPQLLNNNLLDELKSNMANLDKKSPLYFEFLVMTHFVEGSLNGKNLNDCLKDIYESVAKEELGNQELLEKAKQLSEIAERSLRLKNEINSLSKEKILASTISLKTAFNRSINQIDQKIQTLTSEFQQKQINNIDQLVSNGVLKIADKMIIDFLENQINNVPLFATQLSDLFKHLLSSEPEAEKFLDSISQLIKTNSQNDLEGVKKRRALTNEEFEEEYEDLMCPISYEIMEDPVMAEDGHSYERVCIEEHFKKSNLSPLTGNIIGKNLIPNHTLKKHILSLKQKQSQLFQTKKQKTNFEQKTSLVKENSTHFSYNTNNNNNQTTPFSQTQINTTIFAQKPLQPAFTPQPVQNTSFQANNIYATSVNQLP